MTRIREEEEVMWNLWSFIRVEVVDVTAVMFAARSDVFSAMFEHEMEERKHVSIYINYVLCDKKTKLCIQVNRS